MKQQSSNADIPNYSELTSTSPLHSLSANEMEEIEWLMTILAENKQFDNQYQDSWSAELKHFTKFIGSMLLAFPSGLFMRKLIRRNKQLSFILQFPALLSVRNNIEKGSFAYDTLLFKQSAFQVLQNKSHLANLVCLAILFGDEFIDGLAITAGKQTIRTILQDEKVNCKLQYHSSINETFLYYAFDIRDILPTSTLHTINEKYGITYYEFYDHLLFLLAEMNRNLNLLKPEIRITAAQLICQVCNRCFDTYKTDIAAFKPDYHLRDLLQYLDKKDDDIVHCLLTLRAVLLEKHTTLFTSQFKGWSTMVRSMQIYDDMEDAASDSGYQMNFACYFAYRFYKKEWDWLQATSDKLQLMPTLQRNLMMCLHMPASVIACRQYAKHIIVHQLSWVQKKITGYLWKKNWLGWNNDQYKHDCSAFVAITKSPLTKIQKITLLKNSILQIKESLLSEDNLYAHLLETAFLDPALRDDFFRFIPTRTAYFLKHHFFDYPDNRKAFYTRKWLLHIDKESSTSAI
jgi:hypothetical protein